MYNIRLSVGGVELAGSLDDSVISTKIMKLMPVETIGETWGKELYFPVSLHVENAKPVSEVAAGDIAYWPDGPDLCLFFGPTPQSTGEVPVVTSPVTVIGTFQFDSADFDRFERRRQGIRVRVEPQQ